MNIVKHVIQHDILGVDPDGGSGAGVPPSTLNVGANQTYTTMQAALSAAAAATDHFTFIQVSGATVSLANKGRIATVTGAGTQLVENSGVAAYAKYGFFSFGGTSKVYPCEIVSATSIRLVMPFQEATLTTGTLHVAIPNIRQIVLHGDVSVPDGEVAYLSPDATQETQANYYALDIVCAPGATFQGNLGYSCRSGLLRFSLRNKTGNVFLIRTPTDDTVIANAGDTMCSPWVVFDQCSVENAKSGDTIALMNGTSIVQVIGSKFSGSFDCLMPYSCGGRVEIMNSQLESRPSFDGDTVANQPYTALFKDNGGDFLQFNSAMRVAGYGTGETKAFVFDTDPPSLTGCSYTAINSPVFVEYREGADPVTALTALYVGASTCKIELHNSPVIIDQRFTLNTAWRQITTDLLASNIDVRLFNSPLGNLRTTQSTYTISKLVGSMGEMNLTDAATLNVREVMPLQSTVKKLTLTQNVSIPNPGNDLITVGARMEFIFTQDATGGRTVTFSGSKYVMGTVTSGAAATAGQSTRFELMWNGTNYVQVSPDNVWR